MAAAARALPYLLVLLAFALRLYRIDYQSIWRDEGVSLHLAASSIPAILANRAGDVHPPLYFILLHFWARLAGFSELSGRFFSLLFGVLLVPGLYFVVGRVFGKGTALVAMAVAVFSPLYVVYSQEVRTYSMLPLLYLFIIHRLYQLWRGEGLSGSAKGLSTSATEGRPRPDLVARLRPGGAGTPLGSGFSGWGWRDWLALAAVEVVSPHLHYFAIFAVAYVNLFVAALWLRRRGIKLRCWLVSQGLVVLCCLPWAWMVIEHWVTEGPPKTYFGNFAPREGINPLEVASLVWHFSHGGYDLRGHRLFVVLSSLLAAAAVVALPLALRVDQRRRETLITLCHWAIPLAMAFALWWWKPRVSPRYVIMFTVPFFILLARTIVVSIGAGGMVRLAGTALAMALAATFALGLGIVYFDPAYFKDDVRGLAECLESLSGADDLIVVHSSDYAVGYYYAGEAPMVMIDPDEARDVASLEEALRGKRRVFLAWPFGVPMGGGGQLPFLLEMNGRLVDRRIFRGYSLGIYELGQPGTSPDIQPISADFGDLRLTGAFYQREVAADDAICLALRWRLVRETERTYKVVVILWDEVGRRLSSADAFLTNGWGLSTEDWIPGEEAVNYYIVPVPLGTPPLSYRLTVGVYDAATLERLPFLDGAGNPAGEDFPLGEVRLTRARDFERDPYGTRKGLHLETLDESEVAPGLALEGFAVEEDRSARTLSVTLRWRALRGGLPRYEPRLRLRHGGEVWAEVGSALFEERYLTTEWAEGEVVFERRDMVYPPKAGRAVLEIAVNGSAVRLAEVELETPKLLFEPPPMGHEVGVRFGEFAELLGYDLDRTEATTDQKVRLTLYWRAVSEEPLTTSYTVFTHLLSEDGRLIGQHDGVPVGGERPTTSWVSGEVIVDVHEMEFKDLGYRGRALIEVGLYESFTIERVLTEDGRDHIILPTEIVVKSAGR